MKLISLVVVVVSFSLQMVPSAGRQLKKGTDKSPDLYFHQPDGTVFVDTNPSNPEGDVPGFQAIINKPIYLSDRETEIGILTGACTRIVAGKRWYCIGTYELMDGSEFVVSGPFFDGVGGVNAILGGTGDLESVGGQAFYEVEDGWNMVSVYFD